MRIKVHSQNDDSQRSEYHLRLLSSSPSSSCPLLQPAASTSKRVDRIHPQILILLAVGGLALTEVGGLFVVSVNPMGLPWYHRAGLVPVLVSTPGISGILIASGTGWDIGDSNTVKVVRKEIMMVWVEGSQ